MSNPVAELVEGILRQAAAKRDAHLLEAIDINGWPTDPDYLVQHIRVMHQASTGISEWSHDGVPFFREVMKIEGTKYTQSFQLLSNEGPHPLAKTLE
jgi:hypothetical protein